MLIHLRFSLIITLISVSFLDDEHCKSIFKICPNQIPADTAFTGSISNCLLYHNKEKCRICNFGYALSANGKSCISFDNCNILNEGNEECEDCYEGYYLGEDGKCHSLTDENCKVGTENGCLQCADYAAFKGSKCEVVDPIIEGCKEYQSSEICSICDEKYRKNDDGTCEFIPCENDEEPEEYCGICELGYVTNYKDGKCKLKSEFNVDTNRAYNIKAELFLLAFIVAIFI